MMRELARPSETPPDTDELRIDVFGPGVGECILVHLGNQRWAMIDSCANRRSGPVATAYLSTLGVDLAEAITHVVATHWHDDHVRGLSEVYAAAPTARMFATSAVNVQEFRALTGVGPTGSRFSSGVSELSRLVQLAQDRGSRVETVGASQRLLSSPTSVVTAMWALSPSQDDIAISREYLAQLLPNTLSRSRRVPALEENDSSVAILLETRYGLVLLGGDLEHRASVRTRGWHAVVDLDTTPQGRAVFFKVPHHGSETAECPEIWASLVSPDDPICVVTPFTRTTPPLPRAGDRSRLKERTNRALLTSDRRETPVPRTASVAKTIRESTRRYEPEMRMGHVQVRFNATGVHIGGSVEAVWL
jgi:hypothetical protein